VDGILGFVKQNMKNMKTHKDLVAWQKSIELVTEIYTITKDFPKEEVYGITSQIRRSAVSIPSNIAEGAGRRSQKELIQFLYIALGSLSELETQIIISYNLSFITQEQKVNLDEQISTLIRIITALIKSLQIK
jgi:four helix bundle protein